MNTMKRGLGRGLGSLIPQKRVFETAGSGTSAVVYESLELKKDDRPSEDNVLLAISPHQISVNPFQPRKNFDHQELEELINSIKAYGMLQPLIVSRKGEGYELIAGERRLRAAKILEMEKVPVIVRDVQDHEKLELALIENIQRQKLNPIEEACAYRQLIDEFNLTYDEVASRVGKSRSKIANCLRILTLPQEVISAIRDGVLSEGHAKVIAGLESDSDRLKMFRKVLAYKLNVREVEDHVRQVNRRARRLPSLTPELLEKQDHLRKALSTKVYIKPTGPSGTILIEYYSPEDLDQIMEVISEG